MDTVGKTTECSEILQDSATRRDDILIEQAYADALTGMSLPLPKFKVGDRVMFIPYGEVGTVLEVDWQEPEHWEEGWGYRVDLCPDYWVYEEVLELAGDEAKVI